MGVSFIPNLNFIGLFPTERGKRDPENWPSILSEETPSRWVAACYICSVIQSRFPISISLVSFPGTVAKETKRTDYRLRVEISKIEETTLQMQKLRLAIEYEWHSNRNWSYSPLHFGKRPMNGTWQKRPRELLQRFDGDWKRRIDTPNAIGCL